MWPIVETADLHPDWKRWLPAILTDAERVGLIVRKESGGRANARQQQLFEAYRVEQVRFEKGLRPTTPHPAAPPGKSAHNYSLCVRDPAHVVGPALACPVCGASTILASLALDVSLRDEHGNPIVTGGELPLAARPPAWRTWAEVLDRYELHVRDGGDFHGRTDTVHFELIGWNVLDHTYRSPTEER